MHHRTADIQLALAYDCIEQAKLERLNFLTSEPLLLIDRSKPNEYSNSITNNNKIVSLTPSKSTPQSLNILNHEDTYEDYYEDDEDWIDERDLAMQELQNRTLHLEKLLQEQRQQHDQELDELHDLVHKLKLQATSSLTQLQHTSQPSQLSQLPPKEQSDTTLILEKERQEYIQTIRRLEEHLQEMSNKVSSHELQVVTDSSVVVSDMSLKLGEQLGENKWLKRRIAELTEEAKAEARAEGRAKIDRMTNDTVRAEVKAEVRAEVRAEVKAEVRAQVQEEFDATQQQQQIEENKVDVVATTTAIEIDVVPATPATVVRGKENTKKKTNNNMSVQKLKEGVLRVTAPSDLKIEDRIDLASKLRKLEKSCLDLLSTTSGGGDDGMRKKKNKIRYARRRLY